jgi:hypothetical protein
MTDASDDTNPKWDAERGLIPEQPETWVYLNPFNQVVIRQKRWDPCGDDEPYVFVCLEHVSKLIGALERAVALAEYADAEADAPEPQTEPEASKLPLTAAERQRRRRDGGKRVTTSVTGVTKRVTRVTKRVSGVTTSVTRLSCRLHSPTASGEQTHIVQSERGSEGCARHERFCRAHIGAAGVRGMAQPIDSPGAGARPAGARASRSRRQGEWISQGASRRLRQIRHRASVHQAGTSGR